MRGNEIIVSANPQGKFLEGTIVGTPKPGSIMEIIPNTGTVSGRHSWRVSSRAAGKPRLHAVLLADQLQGKLATDAYVTGTRGFLYVPINGEELNMRVDVPGTGSGAGIVDIGEDLMVKGNGHLQPYNGSAQSMPFTSLESVADDASGEVLCWCVFNG